MQQQCQNLWKWLLLAGSLLLMLCPDYENNEDRNKIMFSALPSELIMKIQALTKNYEDLKETVIKNYKEPNWVEKLINDARMIGWPSTT